MKDKLLQAGINLYKEVARYYTFLPRQMKIESTKVCNLHCAGCRRNFPDTIAKAPGPKHLTRGALAEAIRGVPMKVIRFAGDGEPLCNPNIKELLVFLDSRGIRSAITTNATLLDEDWVKFLEKHKVLRVSVSFDGARKETFEALRGGAEYEQVVEACKFLGKSNMQFFLNCLLSTDDVIEQLPEYVDLAKAVGATGIHIMKYQSQDINTWVPPDFSKHAGILEKATKKAKDMNLLISMPYYGIPAFIECEDPYIAPFIDLSGNVYACTYMANLREYEVYQGEKVPVPHENFRMGNIREAPLRDIWKNKAFKELRTYLKQTSHPAGFKITGKELLRHKSENQKGRFSYCKGCPCRWGESGL